MLGLCSFTFSAQWYSINIGINFMVDNLVLKNQSAVYQNEKNCVIPLNNMMDEYEIVNILSLLIRYFFT
jgi:hypothetical protein